jgi:hypothetical protein
VARQLFGDNLHVQAHLDLWVETERHLVGPERPERLFEVKAAAIDFDP